MPISECCNIGVVCCEVNASIPEVAALMRKHHVGNVIVVENRDGMRLPIGIMTPSLVTVHENQGFVDTLRLMRHHKIRRMPIVTEAGTLFGIVTADDIINLLAMELSMMTGTIAEQTMKEEQLRH
jgi:CBS domain-containing protein